MWHVRDIEKRLMVLEQKCEEGSDGKAGWKDQ